MIVESGPISMVKTASKLVPPEEEIGTVNIASP